jgi:hypothetical protein
MAVTKKNITNGQNSFDATLQFYGTIESLFDFLEDNNFEINTELKGGLTVDIDSDKIADKIYVNQLESSGTAAGSGEGSEVQDPLLTTALQQDDGTFLISDTNNYITVD